MAYYRYRSLCSSLYIEYIFQINILQILYQETDSTRISNDDETNMQHFTDHDATKLLEEISRNLRRQINVQKLYHDINKKKNHPHHIFMVKHELILSDSGFIAIILWTESETLTKQYDINKNQWPMFDKSLTNGIHKIHKAVSIVQSGEIFGELPTTLYRGTNTTRFDPNAQWRLNSAVSFTT